MTAYEKTWMGYEGKTVSKEALAHALGIMITHYNPYIPRPDDHPISIARATLKAYQESQ